MTAPVLVIGIGNPSRGDDALGPLLIEQLAALGLAGVDLLTDFQLQIEHALDMAGRDAVIFVDASVSAPAPFAFTPLLSTDETNHSSHAVSPATVLATCQRIGVMPPRQAHVLAIRGERFELGMGLGEHTQAHLDAAVAFLTGHLAPSK